MLVLVFSTDSVLHLTVAFHMQHGNDMGSWVEAFTSTGLNVMSKWELLSCGATERGLTSAVRFGHLVRLRRDRYCLPSLDAFSQRAIRVGGRLACVSALATYGVFAFDLHLTHIHLKNNAARLRSPRERCRPLDVGNRVETELHWSPLIDSAAGDEVRVGILDALAQAVRCTHPWHAIASIDNALHMRLITEADVAEIFRWVPARLQWLRSVVDGRAESGQESVLRMIVHETGLHYDLQRQIDGVGRIDMLVEECVAVEADSRTYHEGWEAQVRDRARDLELAVRGYASLRPTYAHTMYNPGLVRRAVVGLVEQQIGFGRR